MHRALQVHDVYLNILSHLGFIPRHAILHLALVCKAFHEPALDILWRDMQGLEKLLRTFPEDVWEGPNTPRLRTYVRPIMHASPRPHCDGLFVGRFFDAIFVKKTSSALISMPKGLDRSSSAQNLSGVRMTSST